MSVTQSTDGQEIFICLFKMLPLLILFSNSDIFQFLKVSVTV